MPQMSRVPIAEVLLLFAIVIVSVLRVCSGAKTSIIVNPAYKPLQEVDKIRNELKSEEKARKITGSIKQMADISKLRNEIHSAVKADKHIHTHLDNGPSPKQVIYPGIPPFFDLFKFFMELRQKELLTSRRLDLKERDEFVSMVAAAFNATLNHTDIEYIKSELAKYEKSNDDVNLQPNIVDSNVLRNLRGKPQRQSTASPSSLHRETLQLLTVTEDLSFYLGVNILAWKTVQAAKRHVLVGITRNTVLLVLEQNGRYEVVQELPFETDITSFTVFMKWNGKAIEGYVVVGIAKQLVFVRIEETLRSMETIWTWTIQQTVKTMTHFPLNGHDTLLVMHDSVDDENAINSADIYRIDIGLKHTWLLQKIPLAARCASVESLDVGRDYVLVFAQNNTAELYRYSSDGENSERFVHFESIASPDIQTVASFRIGGLSYIAIGGRRPQILRYYRQQFHAQTILSQSWGLVEQIVPIPARTYRDDLILFVQHRIELDSHSIPALEALIWNGQAFETAALSVPCMIGTVVVESGITCVLDFDRDEGITGSSIIQRGTDISLLVPRHQAPSGLFHLQFKLAPIEMPKAHRTTDYDPYEQLQHVLSDQDRLVMEAESAARNSIGSEEGAVLADWTIDALEVAELRVDDVSKLHIDQLYFGDHLWTEEDADVDIASLLVTLDRYQRELDELELGLDIDVRAQPIKLINKSPTNGQFDVKTLRVLREKRAATDLDLDKVHIKQLNVEFINGISVDDFIFLDEDEHLNLSASVLHANNVTVKETLHLDADSAEPKPSASTVTELHVTGDVHVDNINGVNWDDFASRIVMTIGDYTLKDVHLDGEIIAQDALFVGTLNGKSFLNDFLWNVPDAETAIITGRKNFTGKLHTGAIDTDPNGLIDGTRTFEVVTLSGEQFISGDVTFTHLEVTEQLDVSGNITGKHLNDFLANPNLMQTNVIPTDCFFSNLHVEGPIHVHGDINGLGIDEILADVIYKNNPKTICPSFKTFDILAVQDVQLTSNLLNGNEIENYLTTDTDQIVSFDQLNGTILMQNLQIDGLFDLINVTELDANAIKLTGDQYTEAHLIFENDVAKVAEDISAEKLEVLHSVNGIVLGDLVATDASFTIDGDLVLTGALIDELIQSNGDFTGTSDVVNGIHLNALDANRLSYSRSQQINGSFHVQTVIVEGDLDADCVNGYEVKTLLENIDHIRKVPDFLRTDETALGRLIVTGNVDLSHINGHDLEVIKENAIWLDRSNQIPGTLRFADPIIVNGPLTVHRINAEVLSDFLDGLASRSTLDGIQFSLPMRFTNGIQVTERIETSRIGNVATDSILRKVNPKPIKGSVKINGNVYASNVQFDSSLNDGSLERILNEYRFDDAQQMHVLQSAKFGADCAIDNLRLRAGLNGLVSVDGFLRDIVRRDSDRSCGGRKVLKGKINFEDDLIIGNLNGFDVTTFLDQVVLNVVGEQTAVLGSVAFSGKVTANDISVRENLLASNVMGCSLGEWLNNTLRTDANMSITQHLHFADGSFRARNVHSLRLNGLEMDDVITKHTQQNVSSVQYVASVFSNEPIEVYGLVNGMDLRRECENTVMLIGDHYITSETTFYSARVLESLQTPGTINKKNLKAVAPLVGEILLSGAFSFGSVSFEALNTNELISGIDMNYWAEQSLKKYADHQLVNGTWHIDSLQITGGNVGGSGELNGLDIGQVSSRLSEHQSNMDGNLQEIHQDYKGVCGNVKELVGHSKKSAYSASHFEEQFKLEMNGNAKIRSMHFLKANGNKYLLANFNCTTMVFSWNETQDRFVLLHSTETGAVDQWIEATDEFRKPIVVSNGNDDSCNRSGLNSWMLKETTMAHLFSLNELGRFSMIHADNQASSDRFYALRTTGPVLELNLAGEVQDEWNLPSLSQTHADGSSEYRFVPGNVNLGLALSDGCHLSRLTSTKKTTTQTKSSRRKRTFELIEEMVAKADEALANQTMPLIELTKAIHGQLKNATDTFNADTAQRLGAFRNISINQSEPGFFENGYSLGNLMAPNFSNTSSIKLNLLKFEPPQPLWPSRWSQGVGTTTTPIKDSDSAMKAEVDGSRTHEPIRNVVSSKADGTSLNKGETEMNANRSVSESEQPKRTSNARTDLFGEIEDMAKPIADEITDAYVDIKNNRMDDTDDDDDDDVGTVAPEKSTSMSIPVMVTPKSESSALVPEQLKTRIPQVPTKKWHSKARIDLFGEIEDMAKPIADEITDAYVDIKNNGMSNDDDDDDDVGTPAPTRTLQSTQIPTTTVIKLLSRTQEPVFRTTTRQPNGSRPDLFSKIEVKPLAIVENLADGSVEIRNGKATVDVDGVMSTITPLSDGTIISSQQTPLVDSDTSIAEGDVTGKFPISGIGNNHKDSIKNVWITSQEGKEPIEDSRSEIQVNAREKISQHGHLHRGAHNESEDDYDDDRYMSFANNGTDERERKIAVPIVNEGGVATMENDILPGRGSGELVALYVGGGYKKTLVAVSSQTDHVVKGKHDVIRIYEDVIEGRLYQTIGCHRPRSLTAIRLRDETLLAFVEKESEVQIYIYRGIEGFTTFSQFAFPSRVTDLQAVTVPAVQPYACARTFLAISMGHEIRFLEAIANGYCGLEVSLDCD